MSKAKDNCLKSITMINNVIKIFHMMILLSYLKTSASQSDCPFYCVCAVPEGNEKGIRTVTCSNEIPETIPSTVTTFIFKMTSINNLMKGMIGNFSSLKILDLQRADIRTIEDNAFDNLFSLKELKLSNNLITNITNYTFTNCTNLQKLHLDRNKLKVIEMGAFAGLINLRELDLSDNSLRSMPILLPKLLVEMNLKNNFISALPSSVLKLNSLKRLDMCGNKYTSFLTSIFDAPNLKHLCLGDELIDFDKNCVSKISQLQSLKIVSKEIDYEVLLDTLSQLKTLNMLDLSDSTILSSRSLTKIQWQNFTFPNLGHLRLSKTTMMGDLCKAFMSIFPNINILDFRDSPELVSEVFSESNYIIPKSITTLVVSNTNLKTLKDKGVFQNLKTLDISDNPLQCDCDIEWIVERQKKKTLTLEYSNHTYCYLNDSTGRPNALRKLHVQSKLVYEKICQSTKDDEQIKNSKILANNNSIFFNDTVLSQTHQQVTTTEITTNSSEESFTSMITKEHIFYTLLILSILIVIIIIVLIVMACKIRKKRYYEAVRWRYKRHPQKAASCSSSMDEFTIPEIIKESKEQNKRSTAISATGVKFN